MVKKELRWRGKTLEELQRMELAEFMKLVPSRERRKLRRGFTSAEQKFLKRVQRGKKNIETRCRDMVIVPALLGTSVKVHMRKEFVPLMVDLDMLGHRLGEFALTRKGVHHSAPGIGATRSSSAISVK